MESFREHIREANQKDRIKHRESTYNQRRMVLGKTNFDKKINSKDVIEITLLLKNKKQVDLQWLLFLKLAFIQDEENINAFLKSNTLYILVKELSGRHESLQLAAAGCFCNLSLGSSKQCLILTKAASTYLMTHLNSFNTPLIDTCVWTLGNLASDLKSFCILHHQGLGTKLAGLLLSNSDCIESIIYALTHFVHTGFILLKREELCNIATGILPLIQKEPSAYWLTYLLSCSSSCDEIFYNSDVVEITLKLLVSDRGQTLTIQETTALVRVLGNFTSDVSGRFSLKILDNLYELFSIIISCLSSPYAHLSREVLWLVGNLIHHRCIEVQNKVSQCGLWSRLEPHLQLAARNPNSEEAKLSENLNMV